MFAEGWALPKPGQFLDFFRPLIHHEATFSQPMFADAHGRDEIERMFRRLFALFPDLGAKPLRSAVFDDTVFIESECTGTLGYKPFYFSVCDRFVIEDGKILDRRSFSDPSSAVFAVLRRPTSWPRVIRSRIA
jgi:limonene-1,2-epoxide hydrolase